MKYVIGMAVVGVGIFLILKTEWMVNNFGHIGWADEHLGFEGGTRALYKIIGVVLIIFAFLAMVGAFNGILSGVFGGAFRDTGEALRAQ